MLAFFAHRQISGVEHIGDDTYTRVIELKRGNQNIVGWMSVAHAPQRYAIDATVPVSLTPVIAHVLGRVRRMFDLAARPDVIDLHLGGLAAEMPGMRIPGTFDGFEVAARAIVGQQISVLQARTILSRVADALGLSSQRTFRSGCRSLTIHRLKTWASRADRCRLALRHQNLLH